MAEEEHRICESKSSEYRGVCLLDANCDNICKAEPGFTEEEEKSMDKPWTFSFQRRNVYVEKNCFYEVCVSGTSKESSQFFERDQMVQKKNPSEDGKL
ncbi:hypothetical protein Goshw_019214 [Gossypium schwendimanii]|uniref:Knottins-like domain-containing protein n=1 Tax=Gossypium schwendimanii TaxID=34291 RepID=A0A7J9N585_GOSSC|nr:hypothetical protein [Gossypium schwendimanii]